jgi:sialate O-acetylesterase
MPRISTCLLYGVAALALARADVKLPAIFSDNVVLQQAKPIAVWGWADDGEKVSVALNGQTTTTEGTNGRWMAYLPKMDAGGPHKLEVRGRNSISVENVLIGEVWVCSGQSNMEWPLRATFEPQKEIAAAANPKIRLFTVSKAKAAEPMLDVKGSWMECDSNSVPNFSAVAYYFGRDLQKALNVPIGLIHTSWGGSPAEVWIREEIMAENPLFKAQILDPFAAQEKPAGWRGWRPAELYNGMIAPLIPYSIRGAIWYQGESNAGRAHQYQSLFAAMISNWRHDFGQGDFPFLFVQLAPWDKNRKRELAEIAKEPGESDWAELREAQVLATKTLPNVGMAVITDVGDKDDIHPPKKEPVGHRLALAARAIAHGQNLIYSGPRFRSLAIEGDEAIVSFDHAAGGLEAKGSELQGFAIAGDDRHFVWAQAEIRGDKVVVSSPEVPRPVAVRYGWADFPVVNLFNKAGLPASPFRTDSFPMTTGPKLVVKK